MSRPGCHADHSNEHARMQPGLYLASASPRRHDILNQIGVPHQVLDVPAPPGADEPQLANESAESYVLRTATEKAIRARHWMMQEGLRDLPILSADTTVILDGEILHKPADAADAARMLSLLSGRTHEVRTAIVLADHMRLMDDVAITAVTFKTLSAAEIDWYCDSKEAMGKAGAYGIQGLGGAFVSRIEGTFTGVMGLPVFETLRLLDVFGVKFR